MTDAFSVSIEKQTGDISTPSEGVIFPGYKSVHDYTESTVDVDTFSGKCVECPEGTIIRVFNHGDRWYVATNKKLDAFASRFMSKKETFGDSFTRVLKDKYDMTVEKDFDVTKKYVFLLKPSQYERSICDLDEDVLFICCDSDTSSRELAVLPRRREVDDFPSYSVAQGLFFEDEMVRVYSDEYALRKAALGKTPSLRFRYLELRTTDLLELFFSVRPEMRKIAELIEEQIYSVAKYLHSLYMHIFVKNDLAIMCTKTERGMLNLIHKTYMTTKQRTIPSRINDLLAQIPPTRLNKLLREAFVTKLSSINQNNDAQADEIQNQ